MNTGNFARETWIVFMLNPDGTVAVVVMNASDKKADYSLWVDGNAAEVSSLPHSMQTLVF